MILIGHDDYKLEVVMILIFLFIIKSLVFKNSITDIKIFIHHFTLLNNVVYIHFYSEILFHNN